MGGGYFTVTNTGNAADRLVGGTSDDASVDFVVESVGARSVGVVQNGKPMQHGH